MEYRNGRLNEKIRIQNGNASHEYANDNVKKKTKKWSLSSLFKKRRTKSSDTDSSSETDYSKKGFLARSHRRKGGSHRVVGKFEAKIINNKKDDGHGVETNKMPDFIERYDASPNVIQNRYHALANGAVSRSNQEIRERRPDSAELTKGSCGSLESAGRRQEKQKLKARVQARRMCVENDSSSSDNCLSSRTSNSSLQRLSNEYLAKNSAANSLSRKSRAARTDRYLRRHCREEDGKYVSNSELRYPPTHSPLVGSPKMNWVAKVVYHESSDLPFTNRVHSVTSSPFNSPPTKAKTVYCSSWPSRPGTQALANTSSPYGRIRSPPTFDLNSLPKTSPPPPPPRNPNRKITFPADVCPNRPSSYAFDAHARPCEINDFVQNNQPTGYGAPNRTSLRLKSNSDLELRKNEPLLRVCSQEVGSYVKENSLKKYCADRKPRSRNPIQLVEEKENKVSSKEFLSENCKSSECAQTPVDALIQLPLSKANEIGIPVTDETFVSETCVVRPGTVRGRPLSVVSEKSDNELLHDVEAKKPDRKLNVNKRKPKNLEEALRELEEIYNSLKLSDEDLLDRAERRDLQSALRMNPNFSRYSLSDLENTSTVDGRTISSAEFLSSGLLSPRLPSGRRSAVPDTVQDDMAYRKLNKKDNQDAKSTSNIVSQSGSFLLVSPTLSPPPLVDIPPITLPLNKEPDITLDDVVFRKIRHTNNSLRVADPQPLFGIPLGPVSPAANSDYLHAVPGEKYRSTFNPSRTPDVVKDDLAFRNLRKDVRQQPTAEAKKRRAIRSLSANVVSLIGKHNAYSDNESSLVDVNGNNVKRSARCVSFDDLPDVLANYRSQRQALLRNCDECLTSTTEDRSECGSRKDHTIGLIANEAKMLRRKLRELEALPLVGKVEEVKKANETKPTTATTSNDADGVFVKRVVLHKPITLSKFEINSENADGTKNTKLASTNANVDLPEVADRENGAKNCSAVDGDDECHLKYLHRNSNNVVADEVHTVCSPLKETILDEDDRSVHRKVDHLSKEDVTSPKTVVADFENSSSGVSSTSETPDSCAKSEPIAVARLYGDSYRSFPLDSSPTSSISNGNRAKEVFLDNNVFPALENASEQFSKELNDNKGEISKKGAKDADDDECPRNNKLRTHCSSVHIRLSAPEPSGVGSNRPQRWSVVETKDAAIMTEEFGLNGGDDRGRMKKMSGDSAQSRMARYKEERKKQLASQFANLMRNRDSTSSSSATDVISKKATFRPHNMNTIQDDELRWPKLSNHYRNTHKLRSKEDPSEEINEHNKRKSNGSLAYDSPSNSSSKSNRDKSAKRKSYLNRSINSEKTPSVNHNHTQRSHHHYHSADEESVSRWSNRTTVSSSLPVPVDTTPGSTPSSVSSQKSNASPSCKNRLTFLQWPIDSMMVGVCNGFAQPSAPERSDSPTMISAISAVKDTRDNHQPNSTNKESSYEKSKIPRWVVSPLKSTSSDMPVSNLKCCDERSANNLRSSNCAEKETKSFASGAHHGDETFTCVEQKSTSPQVMESWSESGRCNGPCENVTTDVTRRLPTTASSKPLKCENPQSQVRRGAVISPPNASLKVIEEDAAPKPSILKNKFDQRSHSLDTPKLNSILKRKNFEVSHSHSVPSYSGGRQGILKKYSSLDEEDDRKRSRSPELDLVKLHEFKPILKPHRRSSLEEVVHSRSPELHSILKRSKPNHEDSSDSGSNPQGILKRKLSNANGLGSVTCDRISVEETLVDSDSTVKPILKNKQNSLDTAIGEKGIADAPKPILKKKQSSESEFDEEKPKKPILKISCKSLNEEMANFSIRDSSSEMAKSVDLESRNIKPILKKKHVNYMDTRSVKSDDDTGNGRHNNQNRVKRHSLPGTETVTRRSLSPSDTRKQPFAVAENISNLENFLNEVCKIQNSQAVEDECNGTDIVATSGSSRNRKSSRNSDRYRTQPITQEEIVSSQSAIEKKYRKEETDKMETTAVNEVENNQPPTEDTKKSKNEPEKGSDEDVMNKLKRSNSVSMKASLFSQLEKDHRKAAEELKQKKRSENSVTRRKLKVKCSDLGSRFATQPVTWEEVAEAKKQNLTSRKNAVANVKNEILENIGNDDVDQISHTFIPISERVKMFSKNLESTSANNFNRNSRRTNTRFNTQPITNEELQIAKTSSFKAAKTDHDSDQIKKNTEMLTDRESEKFDLDKDCVAQSPRLPKRIENSSETSSQSEGDTSSGGREIQRIIGGKLLEKEKNREKQRKGGGNMNCGSLVAESKDVVDECPVINGNSSIAERLAALQKSGQLDWKKRVSRIAPEKTVSPIINITETQELLKKELTNGFRNKITSETRDEEKKDGSLAERLEKLETSRQIWKNRIEPSDAVQFSVAGKMATTLSTVPKLSPVSSPLSERKKRIPCPSRFRSFREPKKDIHSDPTSPEKSKSNPPVCRSNSLPSDVADEGNEIAEKNENDSIVNVPQIFDEEFSTFFGNVNGLLTVDNITELSTDFSDIKIEGPRLLPIHKKIKAQRKHTTTGNPLKTRASKIEIKNEYREVKSNIAEKEIKRMNVEKLAKNSSLAIEVLAGLASKEDFQAVQLKKAAPLSSPMLPYKPLMLLHVKGRRHVQTRLVKPCFESINSGDSFILITPNEVYHWIGQFSNVIERSRGAEIAQHIVSTHDLGCTSASHIETIGEDAATVNSKAEERFWSLLGVTTEQLTITKAAGSGHPDEDEVYESSLISTNMIYEAKEDELVPVDKYWASIPKIQMLDPNKVLVFDFGSELYVWMGKNVDLKLRKSSVRLAKELWDNGFNYEECDLCPISSATTIGDRPGISDENVKKGKERPDWCLFAKVTQHMETVLFREKFLDWPDFSRVIRAKGKDEDTEKQVDCSLDINPCCVNTMLETEVVEADLVLEGNHLGRGTKYFDEERKRYYMISTIDVQMWHIAEFESEQVTPESLGQFYSTNSYVVKWLYSISYTGRELSGLPSKHTTMGRDRCVYFCWQGKNASLNEQGAAALLTVELDKEKGVQLRISQGFEPPAFFSLFDGRTVIYKKRATENDKEWRLFICRGEIQSEAAFLEVSCNIKQLRSRASFILLNIKTGVLYMWHGCKVTREAVKACQYGVNRLIEKTPIELNLHPGVDIRLQEVNEGTEPKEFFLGLGGSSRKLYMSLLSSDDVYDTTPLLFNLSANSGTFCATSIWPPCRHKELITAYPFLQEDLYSASQPALFLFDSGKELWLWQGWWPERKIQTEGETVVVGEDVSQNSDNLRGSASVRWQAERRAAMQTSLDYWKRKYPDKPVKAFLVWAGLEPIHFTNLFPEWEDRDDVAEINISDGRKPGEMLDVEQELERLTQSTYPIEQLLQRPLPDGVDPTKLELYLSHSHFKEILNVTKEEFAALPVWKQTNMKKNAGLF